MEIQSEVAGSEEEGSVEGLSVGWKGLDPSRSSLMSVPWTPEETEGIFQVAWHLADNINLK